MAGKKFQGGNGMAPLPEKTNGVKQFSSAKPASEALSRPKSAEEILRDAGLADAVDERPEPLSGHAKEASEELQLILSVKYPGREFTGDMISISGILSAGTSPEDISERVRLIRRTLRHFPRYVRGMDEQFTDTYPLNRALSDLKKLIEAESPSRLPSLDVALKRDVREIRGSVRSKNYGPPPTRPRPFEPSTFASQQPTLLSIEDRETTYEQGSYRLELTPRFSAARLTAYALALTAIAATAAFGLQQCGQ